MMPAEPMLSVCDMRSWFHTEAGVVKAVDGVSFDVDRGQVLAIVGESGSGKSVTALSVMGLLPPPGRIESGQVCWKGRDLVGRSERELRQIRGAEMAMVFQEPMSALNPVHTVGRQVAEVVRLHRQVSRREAMERAVEVLDLVGFAQARQRASSYPHQLSGGMRQRVVIAMALACEPGLLIADEPTTALDVTIQAQVLDVLAEIRERTGCAMLLITHDLGVVAGVADRILVMYAGRAVEFGAASDVFARPSHPYTQGLLASLPVIDGHNTGPLPAINGDPPSPIERPGGCAFHPRCPIARRPEPCARDLPQLTGHDQNGHRSACHFSSEAAARGSAAATRP